MRCLARSFEEKKVRVLKIYFALFWILICLKLEEPIKGRSGQEVLAVLLVLVLLLLSVISDVWTQPTTHSQ